MADFPTDLSSVADNVDDVLAKHVNNLEAKIGVNDSAVATSLDYYAKVALPTYSITRQAIINGNFDIWQRGTSVSDFHAGGNYQTADRWGYDATANYVANMTWSRQSLASGDIAGAFYHMRFAESSGVAAPSGANVMMVGQKIEHGTRFLAGAGKKVTLSFWARSDIANKRLGFYLQQDYGAGGTPTSTEIINGDNITLTSTWTKYTHTFTLNTLSGKTFGTENNDTLRSTFSLIWGDDTYDTRVGTDTAEGFGVGYVDIAQVQLCAGEVALPFQPKSFEDELAACQRYCYKTSSIDYAYKTFGVGQCFGTTSAKVWIPFTTAMRDSPTITVSGAADFAVTKSATGVQASTATSASSNSSRDGAYISITTSGNLVAGNATMLMSNNKTTAWIQADAEL